MASKKYATLGIYIQNDMWQEFKECCADNSVSMASVVRDIMAEYVRAKNGKKHKL